MLVVYQSRWYKPSTTTKQANIHGKDRGIGMKLSKRFWVINLVGFALTSLAFYFVVVAPKLALIEDLGNLHMSALKIQSSAVIVYQNEPVSPEQLDRPVWFSAEDELAELNRLLAKTEEPVSTSYKKGTTGYALSVSNAVLTGSSKPVVLDFDAASAESTNRLAERFAEMRKLPWE